jgi:hypothetical protein
MDRSIDASAAEQRGIGGVDDGVYGQRGDVGASGLQRGHLEVSYEVSCGSAWRLADHLQVARRHMPGQPDMVV